MVYRVLAVWMAIASVYIISQGAIPIPGLLGVLAVGALSQDASARKAMQATRA